MSSSSPHICYDRILPRDLATIPAAAEAVPSSDQMMLRAALERAKKWPVSSTLKVRFLSGTAAQQAIVKQFAPKWSTYANIKFEFGNANDAAIRITFDDSNGAWSYIGTDCSSIPRDQPTMNLGWQDESVVLHEFGHAIGLIHEHQNPLNPIQWNKPAVIRDLSGPPNFWDPATIQHNIFDKYDPTLLTATNVDPKSIMMYRIPASWTLDGFHADFNAVLSEVDKSFIGDARNYPFGDDGGDDQDVELTVGKITSHHGEIAAAGERDLYVFQAAEAGHYTIETAGALDLLMSLYGPDSKTTLISEDDDSGVGRNPRIELDLASGKYYVQIRHYNQATGTGPYTVQVTMTS